MRRLALFLASVAVSFQRVYLVVYQQNLVHRSLHPVLKHVVVSASLQQSEFSREVPVSFSER